jgi:hypothetical protein
MGGEEVLFLLILNLGTRWGWVVSVTPRPHFTPGERTSGTHWIGGWVGPRAGLDTGARRKILCPCRGSNSDRPARSQTLYHLSYRVVHCVDSTNTLWTLFTQFVTGVSFTFRIIFGMKFYRQGVINGNNTVRLYILCFFQQPPWN